jgi:adenosylmethionine-8-amino-7-oxononanoate aminotransferase
MSETGRGESTSSTRDLVARDMASVWHPFTQHSMWAYDQPLVIERGEGMHLVDSDGNRYLDGVSSLWVTVHGHGVPEIDDAIRRQLGRLDHSTFLGLTHEPGIELAEKLLATAPRSDERTLSRVFYAGDGASAVEAAIKMAFQAKAQRGEDRPFYLHVAEGYHGDTLGAVSVGGIDLFHHTYRPILLDTLMVSSPGVRKPGQNAVDRAAEVLAETRELLAREGQRVCAIVVEPLVQAAAGMLTHDVSFLRGMRELADEHGAYLVVDEVATGIGRTGTFWAVEQAGVVPDLMTCGKGLTAGYLPLSAVLATEEIYEAFLGTPASGRTFFHGHSYTANPLCAAAAVANLDLMAARGTVAHAARVGERIGELTADLAAYDGVLEIRRIGTMTGIEVRSVTERTGMAVTAAARSRGVLIRPLGDVVVLMPPLAIGDDDLQTLVGTVDECIREVVR